MCDRFAVAPDQTAALADPVRRRPPAPFAATGPLTGAAVLSLRYPDHPVDAESMFVDPRTGDLFIIDKEYLSGVGHVFRPPKRALVDGADAMTQVGSSTVPKDDPAASSAVTRFPGTIITGADMSLDAAPSSCAPTDEHSRSRGPHTGPSQPPSGVLRASHPRSTNLRAKPSDSPRTARAASPSARAWAPPSIASRCARRRGAETRLNARRRGCADAATSLESHREQQQRQEHPASAS